MLFTVKTKTDEEIECVYRDLRRVLLSNFAKQNNIRSHHPKVAQVGYEEYAEVPANDMECSRSRYLPRHTAAWMCHGHFPAGALSGHLLRVLR
jgi:hypothetical protein